MADKEIKFVLSAQDRTAAAIDGLRSRLGGLQNSADILGSSFGKLGLAFAPIGAAATLVAFIKGTTEGIDKLNDLKDATGASIENLSALEDVAARTGTSFDTVGTALSKFNKDLFEASKGSELSNTLKALGLDAQRLREIDPAEALRQTAVALSQFADDGNKARIVQSLFGKSVREVAPFLADLATQTALVAKVTTDQAAAAEKFNQELLALSKNSEDAKRALTSGLLSGLNETIAKFKEASKEGKSFFDVITAEQLRILGLDDGSKLSDKQRAERIANITKLLENQNLPLNYRLGKEKELAALQARNREADLAAENYGNEGRARSRPSLPGKVGADKKSEAERIDATRLALAAYVGQQEKALEKNQQLTEEQKALNLLRSIGTLGEIPQVRELVLGLAAQNDELENQAVLKRLNIEADKERERQQRILDEFATGGGSAADRVREETAALRMNGAEIRKRTELARLEAEVERALVGVSGERREQILALADTMRVDLVAAIEASTAAQKELNASFADGATRALDAYVDAAENKSKQAEDLVTDGIRGMEDALVQFAQTGRLSFSKLADSIISDLIRIGTQQAVSGLVKMFLGGGAGYSPDTTGALFSATGADIAGRRAAGGPVMAGGTYLVGEEGPELLTMGGNGNVTPNNALGKSVIVNFTGDTNVGAGVSRGEMNAALRQSEAAVEGRIRKLARQGSL